MRDRASILGGESEREPGGFALLRWLLVAVLAGGLAACGGSADPAFVPPLEGGGDQPGASPTAPPEAPAPARDPDPVIGTDPLSVRLPMPAPWASAPASREIPPPSISALAAVVVDEASGAVLFDKDASNPLPPASLTKVATAILALEHGGLDEEVTVDVDAASMSRSTVMGLVPGDRFTLRTLLYGLLLPSGNDAALAIGRHVSGSDAAFVADMNALLYRMGMDSSHFANPHGLGSRNHVVSARDLAMLTRYAMTFPEYRDIMRTYSYRAAGSRAVGLTTLNSFTFSYPGADGSKVGYTRSAGQTLIASATRNGHRLYVVVLNSSTRDADAARLLDWAFASHSWAE